MEIILTENDPRLGLLADDGSIARWPTQDSDGQPIRDGVQRYSRRGFDGKYFVLLGVNRDNPETTYRGPDSRPAQPIVRTIAATKD